jgi:outer membrane protein OmpA-like peptidoglycan-associated protein
MMNVRYSLALAGSLFSMGLWAQMEGQNLVKNAGFEEISKEVTTWDQLDRATGWSNANLGSVDLCVKEAYRSTVGQTDGEQGPVTPFEGERCAGFVAWKDDLRPNRKRILNGKEEPFKEAWNKYSEYAQAELSAPLTAGQKYEVSMRVRLSASSDRAVSGIGAYLSPALLTYGHRHFLSEKPQVATTTIITDKANWVEVKGSFTATGQERAIVIGAYPNGGMEKKDAIEGNDNQHAYYFVDGISVVLAPEPDKDGDGVPDKTDQCPNDAGVASLGGCPDKDGDGIADKMDACPDVAGPSNFSGCPDSDGDGLADNMDRCPKVAGVAANKGCPEVKEEVRKLFERALQGVQFETGKSVIKPVSFPILNDVTKVMQENPTYFLEINGHTDSQGDEAKNQKLSDERAGAVQKYLAEKGVADSRMKHAGFGEAQPVADNATSQGRAKNRRVEFKVLFE